MKDKLFECRDPNFTYDVEHVVSGKWLDRPDVTRYQVVGYMPSERHNYYYCKLLEVGSDKYSYVVEAVAEGCRNINRYDVEHLETYDANWFE